MSRLLAAFDAAAFSSEEEVSSDNTGCPASSGSHPRCRPFALTTWSNGQSMCKLVCSFRLCPRSEIDHFFSFYKDEELTLMFSDCPESDRSG